LQLSVVAAGLVAEAGADELGALVVAAGAAGLVAGRAAARVGVVLGVGRVLGEAGVAGFACLPRGSAVAAAVAVAAPPIGEAAPLARPMPAPAELPGCAPSAAFSCDACGALPPPLARVKAAAPAASVAATAAAGTTLPARKRAVLPRGLPCRPVEPSSSSSGAPARDWARWAATARLNGPTLLVPLRLVPAVKESLTKCRAWLRDQGG
jgi:hypothetical protein